jgi:polyisoprenoid-binding protein YceI
MASDSEAPTGLDDYAGNWALDPGETSVEFRTKAMWVLNVKGTLKAVGGKGAVDANGAASGDLIVDAATIATGNKKRDAHLKDGDFLEVSKYPNLTYEATGFRPVGDGRFKIDGTLTVRGESRPLELDATVTKVGTHHVEVTAEGEMDRSQWGLTWAKMGASVHNKLIVKARYVRA